jgi:hypothetical protein
VLGQHRGDPDRRAGSGIGSGMGRDRDSGSGRRTAGAIGGGHGPRLTSRPPERSQWRARRAVDSVFPALRAGARGYLTKDADGDEVETAIRRLYDGLTWLDPVVQARLVAGLQTGGADPAPTGQPAGSEGQRPPRCRTG